MCIFGNNPKMAKGVAPEGWVKGKNFSLPEKLDPEAVIGWRTWAPWVHASMSGDYGGAWRPGEVMQVDSYNPGVKILTRRGNEGIYAHKTEAKVASISNNSGIFWGEVLLWGDLAVYPGGYRAEFAYPLSLFAASNRASTLKAWADTGVYINVFVGKARGADKYGYHAFA